MIARQVMVETMTIVQSKPIFTLENSICVTEETACIQPSPASMHYVVCTTENDGK